MCRSSGAEIYDLAWSPDGQYFIIGSMDNIARIYNANSGEHTLHFSVLDLLSNALQVPWFAKLPSTAITSKA
jgi:WD40 repeat protein